MLLRPYVLAVLGSLLLVGNAHALADFSSLDGSLQFKNFVISDDESFYTFTAIDYGFVITMNNGALSTGDLNVVYDVFSSNGPITGASLQLSGGSGGVAGRGAGSGAFLATVAEDYFALPKNPLDTPILSLTVSASGDDTSINLNAFDSGQFGPLTQLRADKDILQIGSGFAISGVVQTYQVAIPEPVGAVLFGLGATAMGIAISRRKTS